jgi:hypothetical protein
VTTPDCNALGGTTCSGPNGVTVFGNFLFVTDGFSRVVTIDLTSGATVGDVVTKAGDPNRADELAFDPKDRKLLVINNADAVPFGTLIDVAANGALSVATTIPFPFATNGAEQPVWDPATQRFYLTIPEISGVATLGAVIRINPISGAIENMFAIALCSPAGLTLNPTTDELGVGCNTVFDYYATFSGGPLAPAPATVQGAATLGVIDAFSQTLDQLVPTFNVPAVTTGPATSQHPAGTAHSVAANSKNNQVLVALAANNVFENCLLGCIAVYGRHDKDTD